MKCNRCGAELLKSDFCPECRADVSFYKKAARASNVYYNMGLEQAKVRDLSSAIESLQHSVFLDKTNVNARNLLGLCYYELGEVVEALSQWVVSRNFKSEGNPAVDYIDEIKSKKTDFDDKTAAARKYNQALDNALKENYDLAMIQLKKIVSQCPGFVNAQNMLALFYIEKKAYARAEKCLRNVLKTDTGNVQAKLFMKEILANKEAMDKKPQTVASIFKRDNGDETVKERRPLSGNDVIIPKHNYVGSGNGAFSLVNILIGIGIGALIIFFLVVPASKRAVAKEYQNNSSSEKLAEANASIADMNKRLEAITAERDALKASQAANNTSGKAMVDNPEALYYAAKAYADAGNAANAKKYYQMLIDTFASSQYAEEARNYIRNN